MIVKCPICQAECEAAPNSVFRCECGAKFTVGGDGEVPSGGEPPPFADDDPLGKTIPPRRREEYDSAADVTMPGKRDRKPDGRFVPGDVIMGRYEVLSELGQGGMGVVYKCFDRTGGIEVALKALPPELSHNTLEMEDIRDNFRLVAKLVHQNIAISKNLERDNSNGNYYLIMECVEGEDLRRWIKRKRQESGALKLADVLPVVIQVAAALDYAHKEGVIHRDIKPGNIMIDRAGDVKVLDFGLAAQIHTSMTRVSMAYHGTSGTGPYMAPEQWRGRAQGAAADQYALAVMTYEMLAGHLPFESTDASVLREAVLNDTPEPVSGLPGYAAAALRRAMSKEPRERFASCSDFATALAGGKSAASVVLSRIGKKKLFVPILAGAALIVILLVVFALFAGDSHIGLFRKKLSNNELDELQRKLEPLQSQLSKMDRGQTFGTHIDAFAKYYQIGKDALSQKDFSTASDGLQRAEQEAKWLVANAPLREQARKIADEVEQGKSAADRYDAAKRASRSYEATRKEASAATKHFEAGKFEAAIREYSQARDGFRKSSGEARNVMRKEYIRKAEIARDKKDWRTVEEYAEKLHQYDYAKAEEFKALAEKGLKADLIAAAQKAADQHQWDKVEECAAKLRGLGDHDKARELETAANEGIKADLPAVAQKAANQRQWDKVKEYAIKIRPLDSAKADEWEQLAEDGIKQDKLNSELAAARQAKARRQWEQAYFHASAALDIAPGHIEAVQLKQEAWSKTGKIVTFYLSDNITLKMVKVEAGSFDMGSPEGEYGPRRDEHQHRVTLTRDFYIGKTEVTQAQWEAVMGDKPSSSWWGRRLGYNRRGNTLPVGNVTWSEAMKFCEKLNKSGKVPKGWKFTLPTEAQWEYAARGGNKSRGYTYSGSNDVDNVACHGNPFSVQALPVGGKEPNELGLFDMSGNVCEWCLDWYEEHGAADPEFLKGNRGKKRVCRGGSIKHGERSCRVGNRSSEKPGEKSNYIGFRIVLVPAD